MVLGEAYLKGILRPPLADVKALPPNPPHPFQTDLLFYLRQRFFKHHTPLVFGFAVAIYAFTQVDSMMAAGKKKAYDEAIAEGRSPFGHH
ncbi:F1F0 ATP synthase associated 10.0kDa protein [Monoraphidium neglectum]|uniref:F1F0 ATP synthase associated 10.0kDa protein n=1 Tax=Monoraphidium neglectum TaxID=145388 RepID=A0A0D2M6X4_9CHLO|nr:F1F0 ATP synthase associated 10.0kDa protein [Monoraphidium neglectum]KIY96966.1 F1F0 ATP synthase associated 10.0kDa protein [Monoraphidium neglectum]|eukprot:XP_013895986.1 F1F0 ATP synthase associated 10.0kDa protein [Monoraphidium neglectum]